MEETIKTNFKVVLLDESADYSPDFLEQVGGKVMRAYLFDSNISVNAAELRSSYELFPLSSSTPIHLSDDLHEELMRLDSDSNDVIYVHCSSIDKMDTSIFHDFGEETILKSEWQEKFEEHEEYLKGNTVIECPYQSTNLNKSNKKRLL